ncbi:MFS transporter [Methyloraptor flagellatus]|uniref:MFS transporter n=1 Tax=Methyloraptor flagellatus TaxID=3162530 RepID=A0AAU7X572_9HYPH
MASPSTAAARPAGSRFSLATIVICGCLVAAINFGPRSSMGFFQLPLIGEHGWSRETFSLAMAIQNLMWGVGAALFGAAADRFGTARTLALGAVVYAIGILVMAWAPAPVWLHVGGGVLVGLGVAASSFGIVMAALGRVVSAEKRTLVFGFATAAGSFGQFFFSPLSQALIQNFGWHDGLIALAGMLMLIPLLAIPLQGRPTPRQAGERDQTIGAALAEAFGHRSYLLLVAGFFVCGFQVAFITTHFPAYIQDLGLEARWGVIALMLIGLFNIVGSLSSGYLGMRLSKRYMLSFIYLARSVVFTAFILIPPTPLTVVLFAATIGILWLSTVPPTNGLVALMFGTRYLAMLGGVVFFSHQVGSFLGVWLGGRLYDLNHSYTPVWWLGVALGIFAGIVHLPIREAPVERLAAPLVPRAQPAE